MLQTNREQLENKQTHREQIQSPLYLHSDVTLGGSAATTFISRCRMIAAVGKYLILLANSLEYPQRIEIEWTQFLKRLFFVLCLLVSKFSQFLYYKVL